MSIGRFARATRLSIKALRHYDELGLLRPAAIDPRSGYRYYDPTQVQTAVQIATLRALDVPLPTIARMLADPTKRLDALRAERDRVEQELEQKHRALAGLDRLLGGRPLHDYAIEISEEPARLVAIERTNSSADALEADTTRIIRALWALLVAGDAAPRDPVMALIGASPDEQRIPLEVAIAVCPEAALPDGVERRELPAVRCARTRHVGPYAELAFAHHALWAWAAAHGHEADAVVREIYRNDPDEVVPDELVTEVLLPLG